MCLLGMQPAVNGLGRASEPCAWSPFYPDLESGSRVNCGEGRLFVQRLSVWSRPARLVLEFHRIVLCKTVAISSPFGVECTCPVEVAGYSFAVAADPRDRVVL